MTLTVDIYRFPNPSSSLSKLVWEYSWAFCGRPKISPDIFGTLHLSSEKRKKKSFQEKDTFALEGFLGRFQIKGIKFLCIKYITIHSTVENVIINSPSCKVGCFKSSMRQSRDLRERPASLISWHRASYNVVKMSYVSWLKMVAHN